MGIKSEELKMILLGLINKTENKNEWAKAVPFPLYELVLRETTFSMLKIGSWYSLSIGDRQMQQIETLTITQTNYGDCHYLAESLHNMIHAADDISGRIISKALDELSVDGLSVNQDRFIN